MSSKDLLDGWNDTLATKTCAPVSQVKPAELAERRLRTHSYPALKNITCAYLLVGEDDADTAASTAQLLRLYGHEIQTSPNGPTALALALARQPGRRQGHITSARK